MGMSGWGEGVVMSGYGEGAGGHMGTSGWREGVVVQWVVGEEVSVG